MTAADVDPVSAHYTQGDLGDTLIGALRAAGKQLDALDPDDLSPVDQFHTGGRVATLGLAQLAQIRPGQAVLDVGGGLGGAARTLAQTFGCRVTVVDLTAEYCRVGAMLTDLVGMASSVAFVHADALDLPFGDEQFDVVWLQHSSMNVEDKDRFYAELRRVLCPGGRLALHEIMTGRRFPVHFPVPWASEQSWSYLRLPAAIRELLRGLGFAELAWRDVTDPTLAAIMAPPEPSDAAPPPSPLGLHLLLGDACAAMQRNLICNLVEERIAIIRAVFERREEVQAPPADLHGDAPGCVPRLAYPGQAIDSRFVPADHRFGQPHPTDRSPRR